MSLCEGCKYNGGDPDAPQCSYCGEMNIDAPTQLRGLYQECCGIYLYGVFETPRARWVYNSFYSGFWECSRCGHGAALKLSTCPACGAIMEED